MIDWDRVTELRDEIGPEDFGEVVELFLEEVEEVVERLKGGADPATLEADLHFLKGSALNLGFETFSNQCQRGETAAAQGRQVSVDVPEILETYFSSKKVFEAKSAE